MYDVPAFLLSVAAAYGYALVVRPVLRVRGGVGAIVSTCVAPVVLFLPLLIPADRVGLRALAEFLCADLMFKMIDYARQHRHGDGDVSRFADYLRFLIPFPVLLVVFHRRERRLPTPAPRGRTVLGVLFAAAVFALGFVLANVAARVEAVRSSFLLDHAVMFVIFMMTIQALSRLLYGLDRLAGFDTTPLILNNAFCAPTVAAFWQRFNTRVHLWLQYNVFRPAGGLRTPVRGVLPCFFVSAVVHELAFGIATSRFTGYQFAFFMLQAPAMLASRPLHRLATHGGIAGKTLAHTTTVTWFFFTSMLFFHGVNRVFPFFYVSESWLP